MYLYIYIYIYLSKTPPVLENIDLIIPSFTMVTPLLYDCGAPFCIPFAQVVSALLESDVDLEAGRCGSPGSAAG